MVGMEKTLPVKVWYEPGGIVRPKRPCRPPPRVLSMDAALALSLLWMSLIALKVGSPVCFGRVVCGKLSIILSTVWTECAIWFGIALKRVVVVMVGCNH